MRGVNLVISLLAVTAACSTSSKGESPATDVSSGTGSSGATTSVAPQGSGGSTMAAGSGSSSTSLASSTTGASSTTAGTGASGGSGGSGSSSSGGTGNTSSASTSGVGSSSGVAATSDGSQGATGSDDSSPGQGSSSASGGSDEPTGAGSTTSADSSEGNGPVVVPNNCVGDKIPDANPRNAGPFQVAADKNVGPLAGVLPDPIYGDQQQRFNVYRPANLADSGFCHPILIWANGFRDNPEQKPPDCIVDGNADRWCGQYLPMMNHLASHGFIVVASLSTATAEGDPLPTIAGLDWILEQAEDPESAYYHRLDTANIGQLGHSYGGMSTCMSASEPRYKALATICGTRALEGVHTPMLFFCGGRDTQVECSGVKNTFLSVTEQPAFFINELDADHGSWVYEGAGGVSLSAAAAWFRAHLMDDAASRQFFYGEGCTFCSDNRVEVEQNTLMLQ